MGAMAELCGCRRIYAVSRLDWMKRETGSKQGEEGGLTKAEVGRIRSERDPLHAQHFVEKVMLLKDVKNSRKVNLAVLVFRQVQLQYVSVLGSRKLTSGTGAFLVSLVVLKYGTGHTGPQSTKSADQPPGFGPLFKPVLFLFLPPLSCLQLGAMVSDASDWIFPSPRFPKRVRARLFWEALESTACELIN